MCDDAISLVFLSPSVHFGVHWVVECAGENQAICRVLTLSLEELTLELAQISATNFVN